MGHSFKYLVDKVSLPSPQLVKATLLTPLLVSGIFSVLLFLYSEPEWGDLGLIGSDIYFALRIGAIIGWPVILVFGLPIHRYLVRAGHQSVTIYAMSGFVFGALFSAAILIFIGLAFGEILVGISLGLGSVFGGPVGCLSAIVFRMLRGHVLPNGER